MPFGLFKKRNQQPPADMPTELNLAATLEMEAAAGKANGKPKFQLVANTGQEPMRLEGFFDLVIIDLAGATFDKESTPVIADHDTTKRIGHTTAQRVDASGIYAEGVVSSSTGIAAGFVADAKAGFPFQVSIGATLQEANYVEPGQSATVNGKEFQGPLIVARRSLIRELSVTVLGADSKTAATIAATRTKPTTNNSPQGGNTMPSPVDPVQIERERINAINQALTPPQAGWGSVAPDVEQLRAAAIGGDVALAELPSRVLQLTELASIRNERPAHQGSPVHAPHTRPGDPLVLEAAIAQHARIKGLEKAYDANTLEAASSLGITCLMDAAKMACQIAGKTNLDWRSKDAVIKASFSSADLGTLLSNVAGKSLEEAYKAFPSVARMVARKLSANDFKQKTGIRITGDVTFLEVAGDGEIKHGMLSDASYVYSVSTFARMWSVDRQSLVNDDLDALEEVPRLLGRGAALALEEAFWTLVLANTGNFFHADNGNLLTGAGSALASSGLSDAVQKFLEQTDQEGKPIGVVPENLVVPPALKSPADELFVARTLNVGGGSASTNDRLPGENVHFGKYEPSPVPWIGSNGGLTGGSDTHWYLFGNPNDVAAFGIAYLDGNETPTIQQEDQSFNKLGTQFRGFLDFGVCQIDHRGAVRSAGA